MDEAGVKGFNLDAWAGLVAPAGTPTPVVNKLNTALREIIDSPEVQARFKNVGFEGLSSTPEELGTFMRVQLGVWEKMLIPNCEFWYKANPPPCQILDETSFLHLPISLGRYCSVSASLWPESGGGCNGGGMSARWSQSMSIIRCCCSVPPIGPLGTSRVEVFGRERRPKSRSGAS
jgi:hypothetical protein